MIASDEDTKRKFRQSGMILARALKELCAMARAGVSAAELDLAAEKFIRDAGGTPTFLGYQPEGAAYPYPAALCISINDEVVHGIPSDTRILKDGDVVSLDLGATYEGFITDAARTVIIGNGTPEKIRLVDATQEALKEASKFAKAGNRVGDIGAAVSAVAKKHNFGVVRELGGHGVGRTLHEDPYIANFGTPGRGAELEDGMVVAIEPIFTLGNPDVVLEPDGYTYRTRDRSLAVHFEDTFLINKTSAEILTR